VGKTTVTLAMIAALRRRGYRVQPFKGGPDFLDTGHHARIAGRTARNLDTWMLSAQANRDVIRHASHGADVLLVEGMMGLLEGKDGATELGSSAEIAKLLKPPVVLVLALGEMGIGNTTSASAITCAITGSAESLATGRGTGLDDAPHARKIAIVEAILKKHFANHTSPHPLELLRCVDGLEIAAMIGMILAAARNRVAIVADAFISTAAAALAVALEPKVGGYLIAGHRSEEPGHRLLLDYLKLIPILSLEMRLGEGSGAVLAISTINSAIGLYSEMATFTSVGISEASP
jgi:nicotinate-nucleotide--dimethylbenzimidazole phosphoribosyltransferase